MFIIMHRPTQAGDWAVNPYSGYSTLERRAAATSEAMERLVMREVDAWMGPNWRQIFECSVHVCLLGDHYSRRFQLESLTWATRNRRQPICIRVFIRPRGEIQRANAERVGAEYRLALAMADSERRLALAMAHAEPRNPLGWVDASVLRMIVGFAGLAGE